MLIMHVIFSMLHENCGYYGNGISQNVAKTYRSQKTQNLFKLA